MLLEYFSDIWIVGEISNFKAYPSGHFYFVLKDEQSQIQAVCFREVARRLKFQPRDGDLVIGHGRLEIYPPSGRYQIVLDAIEPRGLGALQRAFEELKRKLEKEGLFRAERKRPLPRLPRTIGVVTSLEGAAIHDIVKTLRLHRAHLKVLIYPVQVQGEGSAQQIAQAIAEINTIPEVELIIVARGGGSLEDLWSFNEEIVARAIASSRVPVVTGIGHEVDFTIADFVADVRAATPTAAAQIVSRGWEEFEQRLDDLTKGMTRGVQEFLLNCEQRVDELARHRSFELLIKRLSETSHRTRFLTLKLAQLISQEISIRYQSFNAVKEKLYQQNPVVRIIRWGTRLETLSAQLENAIIGRQIRAGARLTKAVTSLDILSPLASLARGYAICQKSDGRVISRVEQVTLDELIKVRIVDGRLNCQVKEKSKEGQYGE